MLRPSLATLLLLTACRSGAPASAPPVTRASAAGSAPAVVRSEVRATRSRLVPLAEWRPAVAAVDSGGACRALPAPDGGGGRVLSLSFPDAEHSVRNVAVVLAADGRARLYSDVRGALRRGSVGPRTAITANLERGDAQAVNEYPDRDGEMAMAPAAEALSAAALDRPERLLDVVRARCGGA